MKMGAHSAVGLSIKSIISRFTVRRLSENKKDSTYIKWNALIENKNKTKRQCYSC